MRTYILITFFTWMSFAHSYACDICGCGIGNNYIGILPDFQKRIFGIRYRNSGLISHLNVDGTLSYQSQIERYHAIEAWAGWDITSHLRLMLSIPLNIDERASATTPTPPQSKLGLGDISFFGYYQALKRTHTVFGGRLMIHSLWLGGGIKFATGEYQPSSESMVNNGTNYFQLGTGSYDFILAGMYDIRLQDFGINFSANYKMNTANIYNYQYGNKFSLNIQPYYKIRVKNKFTVAPNLGLNIESANVDLDEGYKVTLSGGIVYLGTVGVECAVGKFVFGGNFQSVLSQQLANGFVRAEDKFMVHFAVTL